MRKIFGICFIGILLSIFSGGVCFCQRKVVEDPGERPRIISQKTFGTLLKERFLDSIPGLDSMAFSILIDRRGYAKRVTYVENYFAPKITRANLVKVVTFIKQHIYWKPAWVPSKNGIRFFDCEIYEEVNIEVIDKIMSKPYHS